jgi:hypothetical protein
MPQAFRTPKDASVYSDTVFTRCRDLIGYELWSGLKRHRLDAWIANFKLPEERYFAAKVLDNLIYRSDNQTDALMRQLLTRVIPDYARRCGLPAQLKHVYKALQGHADPRVRVVPVIPLDAPPTKSGPVIVRNLKRALRLNEKWMVYPQEVPHLLGTVDVVLFIDDFLGTGDQFTRFLAATKLGTHLDDVCCLYCPLAAHVKGVQNLKDDIPKLHVVAVEQLDDSHALFHPKSGAFPDEVNSAEAATEFYYDLLKSRGIDINPGSRRGFGHFELAYAFEHSVPDNSLPILWWGDSPHWRPLFDR